MIPALILLTAAVVYRILFGFIGGGDPWLPNFAPVAAIALCGPSLFTRRRAAIGIALPLAILFASDLVLNWRYGASLLNLEMLSRYAALVVIALIGVRLRGDFGLRRLGRFVGASLAGSAIFYLVTNSACWLGSAAYAKTAAGWWQALTIGVPGYPPTWIFFRNSLVSDLLFTLLFVGCFAWDRSFRRSTASAIGNVAHE